MESLDRCLWSNGPKPGSFYEFHAGSSSSHVVNNPVKHTQLVIFNIYIK